MDEQEMPLSLREQFESTNVVTQFARLYALDRLWTDYLQRAERPISERDVRLLEQVVGEMDELLQAAPDRAGYLDHVIAEHTEELYESYERILYSEDGLTWDQKTRLRDIVMRRGGVGRPSQTMYIHEDAVSYDGNIAAYGRISAQAVGEMVRNERETLEADMDTIRRGGPMATGDLSQSFGCNLAAGCIIGGLFAPLPMNLVGVGIGLTILLSYEVSGDPC